MGFPIRSIYFFFSSIILYGITNGQAKSKEGHLEFCWNGQQNFPVNPKTQGSKGCSNGVFFNRPVSLKAVTSDSDLFCFKKSVCEENWECGSKKQHLLAQIVRLGKPGSNSSWSFISNDDKIHMDIPQCTPNKLWLSSNVNRDKSPLDELQSNLLVTKSRLKRAVNGLVPEEPTSKTEIQQEVDDQTKRLFYYLTGINQDQVNSHLRVVKLFKMSAQLVQMICDPQYLRPQFLKEVEKSFLFLLKEQGFDKMVDIDLESYGLLKEVLEFCATNVSMVKFFGQSCPNAIKVEKVYRPFGKGIRELEYARTDKTFKWGEYDLVIDAAWGIVTIVHAGCFESFSNNLNLHHKFQVALEQLFHAALYLRWEHPTQLADDTFYDSIFMSNINNTMEVMDACSKFLYLHTPFKLQLNRPIHETLYRRRKRSVEEGDPILKTFSSMENYLTSRENSEIDEEMKENQSQNHVAECFETEAELAKLIEPIKTYCY